ncbi:MAG: hypothetical protein NWR54_04070, partial [Paracoccaceae bacterium]|nr:hypothetical protein [Paracoccaceae bacterium]
MGLAAEDATRYIHEFSGGQRQRADHPAGADHPRRGGLGARRAGAGADPRLAGRTVGPLRAELSVHQPRSERGAHDHRPGDGDEGRRDRRAWRDRGHVRRAEASLHARASGRRAGSGGHG